MNLVSTVRVCLLLRQSRLKKSSDPAGFNRHRRIAINRESRQSCHCRYHVLQWVRIVTRGCWYILRWRRVYVGGPITYG